MAARAKFFQEHAMSRQAKEVRQAYKARKKKVMIDGIMFDLKLVTKTAIHSLGGVSQRPLETIKQKEQWIVATPADGRAVPMLMVEREHQGNSIFGVKASTRKDR